MFLHPKLRSRFRVTFRSSNTDALIDELVPVSLQVVAAHVPTIMFGVDDMRSDTAMLIVDDDAMSSAIKAIHKYGDEQTRFDMLVETLDGSSDAALDVYRFKNARFSEVMLVNPFDYRGSSSSKTATISVPVSRVAGTLIEEDERVRAIFEKLSVFLESLSQVQINFPTEDSTVQHHVVVKFAELERSFKDPATP